MHDTDLYVPDGYLPTNPGSVKWRALASSITCLLSNGVKTGFAHVATLEEYSIATGLPTGKTKPNGWSDANYIPDYIDLNLCRPDSGLTFKLLNSTNQNLSVRIIGRGTGFNQVYSVAAQNDFITLLTSDIYDAVITGSEVPGFKYQLTYAEGLTMPPVFDVYTLQFIVLPADYSIVLVADNGGIGNGGNNEGFPPPNP